MSIPSPAASQPREPSARAGELVATALRSAGARVRALGRDGLAVVRSNQFGDSAVRADVEAEDAVIAVLREAEQPIRLVSEEHGTITMGTGPVRYTAVLDGLDGSSVYKRFRLSGRYGTMLALFEGDDPTYDAYLASGVYEHGASPGLYLAECGRGALACHEDRNAPAHVLSTDRLPGELPILADLWWPAVMSTFYGPLRHARHAIECTSSSAIHYVELIRGRTAAVCECTRKQNLEIIVAYGLVKEAGGRIVTLDGTSIGRERILSWAQDDHTPVIAACTAKVADEIISLTRVVE